MCISFQCVASVPVRATPAFTTTRWSDFTFCYEQCKAVKHGTRTHVTKLMDYKMQLWLAKNVSTEGVCADGEWCDPALLRLTLMGSAYCRGAIALAGCTRSWTMIDSAISRASSKISAKKALRSRHGACKGAGGRARGDCSSLLFAET